MKKGIFAILALLAVFALLTIGCSDSDGGGKTPTPTPVEPKEFFTVTFDKNNTDTGSTDPNPATKPTYILDGTGTVSLPTTPPTRPGYIFSGYNTSSDGRGTEFTRNTLITDDITV
ncbi:InlB B-repeat-containing protein [Treponema sp. R80B11-R83G3]